MFLANGEGGARDYGEAAVWFRRAAERGVVDSQYNLGLLYEAGRGVERNLREAYRWYSVAANAGDTAAREKQLEVEARLKPGERSGLDRDVSAYQPSAGPPADLAMVIPPAETLSETQALLARKGYYVGPVDGIGSPAVRTAAAAYLRDHPEVTPGRASNAP
jgi:localization factor PodJL